MKISEMENMGSTEITFDHQLPIRDGATLVVAKVERIVGLSLSFSLCLGEIDDRMNHVSRM